MLAIIGAPTSRPLEALARTLTVLAVFTAVLAPVLAGFVVVGLCVAMAAIAPEGGRGIAILAAWVPVSLAVLGTTLVG